jgi:antitoxin CcdA
MGRIYNHDAPKKPTNLTVNSDLLAQAKTMKINISATLETALVEAVKQKKREEWLSENADAISNYNEKISEYGLFSDEMRAF